MGIDSDLAVNEVDGELLCSICTGILENPVEIEECEHMFCEGCIRRWMQERNQIEMPIIFYNQVDFK